MRIDPVTDDPQVMADLLQLWDDDGDVEEAARRRGMHPPGLNDGACHGISLYYPPDSDDGLLIWDTSDLGADEEETADDIRTAQS